MEKLLLIGGGEHCDVVLSVLKKEIKTLKLFLDIYGIIDSKENLGKKINGIEIIGTDNDLIKLKDKVHYAFISLGSIKSTIKRQDIYHKIKKAGYKFFTIISVDSIIDESVTIGEGTIIMPGVIINSNAKIGKNTIINTGAIIEHDCQIGAHVHCAPGVVLSGGVQIEAGSHIGTGSTIIQHIHIGHNSIIGAGSVVVKNIKNNIIACGNPCKEIKTNE